MILVIFSKTMSSILPGTFNVLDLGGGTKNNTEHLLFCYYVLVSFRFSTRNRCHTKIGCV